MNQALLSDLKTAGACGGRSGSSWRRGSAIVFGVSGKQRHVQDLFVVGQGKTGGLIGDHGEGDVPKNAG